MVLPLQLLAFSACLKAFFPESKSVLTTVRLGATDGTNTEIISGITEGQKAIIGGGAKAKSSGFGGGPRIF